MIIEFKKTKLSRPNLALCGNVIALHQAPTAPGSLLGVNLEELCPTVSC